MVSKLVLAIALTILGLMVYGVHQDIEHLRAAEKHLPVVSTVTNGPKPVITERILVERPEPVKHPAKRIIHKKPSVRYIIPSPWGYRQ